MHLASCVMRNFLAACVLFPALALLPASAEAQGQCRAAPPDALNPDSWSSASAKKDTCTGCSDKRMYTSFGKSEQVLPCTFMQYPMQPRSFPFRAKLPTAHFVSYMANIGCIKHDRVYIVHVRTSDVNLYGFRRPARRVANSNRSFSLCVWRHPLLLCVFMQA